MYVRRYATSKSIVLLKVWLTFQFSQHAYCSDAKDLVQKVVFLNLGTKEEDFPSPLLVTSPNPAPPVAEQQEVMVLIN